MRKELKDKFIKSNKCADELEQHGYTLLGCFNDMDFKVRIKNPDGNISVYDSYMDAHSKLINKFNVSDLIHTLSSEIDKLGDNAERYQCHLQYLLLKVSKKGNLVSELIKALEKHLPE
jgi:hypothetical protein